MIFLTCEKELEDIIVFDLIQKKSFVVWDFKFFSAVKKYDCNFIFIALRKRNERN